MGWLRQECVCVCVCVLCIRTYCREIQPGHMMLIWICDDSRCTSTLKSHRSSPDPNIAPVAFALWDCRVVFPLHPPSSAQIHRLRLQCAASSGWIHATVPLCSAQKEPQNQWFPCRGGGEGYTFVFIRSMIYYWDVLSGSGWASVSNSSLSPRDVYISWNSHRRREQLQSDP